MKKRIAKKQIKRCYRKFFLIPYKPLIYYAFNDKELLIDMQYYRGLVIKLNQEINWLIHLINNNKWLLFNDYKRKSHITKKKQISTLIECVISYYMDAKY